MNKTMLPSNWNQWALPVLAAAVALAILIFAASLIVIYWGDEYASPGWSEASVPAPRTY